MANCGSVTVASQISAGDVYVTSCGASNTNVEQGGSTSFTAQVANDNDVNVEAYVKWFGPGGQEIEGVIERVSTGGGSVDTGPKTYDQLQGLFGEGDFDFTAEVVEVYEVGSFT